MSACHQLHSPLDGTRQLATAAVLLEDGLTAHTLSTAIARESLDASMAVVVDASCHYSSSQVGHYTHQYLSNSADDIS